MFHTVIHLLLFHLPHKINTQRVCVPNAYFVLNGKICYCDYQGKWIEANCKIIARKQLCQPGYITWQGCQQCMCNDNGQLHCTNEHCYKNTTKAPVSQSLLEYGQRCVPFRSYYVNCSLCYCPASGLSSDAKCSIDKSCNLNSRIMDIYAITKINHCKPNVIYHFPCVQCLCSENGVFVIDKCVQKCKLPSKSNRRCVAGTLYRNDCYVCLCPNNSIPNDRLCEKSDCNKNLKYTVNSLRTTNQCIPRSFTKPRCLYCECLSNGTVNENSCLELDCRKTFNFKYYFRNKTCTPGELVPICIECFCFNNGVTNETYCTRNCTDQSKLEILEKVLNDSLVDLNLIDKDEIKEIGQDDPCELNTVYFIKGRYCICPNDSDTDKNKFCSSIIENSNKVSHTTISENIYEIINASCEPNTLVDFDCNTCYCSKNGKINLNWCTDDDCEAKRMIQESHKLNSPQNSIDDPNGRCTPGSISKVKCNYCICPDSGILRDRACTKNICFDNVELTNDKFVCEPLAYYEVDCNICYCPHDGLKNVDKCTKNHCEKSFLRTNECIPGELFSNECKVCVCPPNGDKADKVCTNNTCGIIPWNAFKLKPSLLENQVHDDNTRKLDLCFPGEEFAKGCDLCVCPELGLKIYATCEPVLCDDKTDSRNISDRFETYKKLEGTQRVQTSFRARRDVHDECFIYNVSQSAERKECTPGSMYIVRCRQCMCPYVGNINNFCRPLPKTFFCEEAFPGFNYLSMGRRNVKNVSTIRPEEVQEMKHKKDFIVSVKHLNHTKYKCEKPGKLTDDCFICECENGNVIEEHCYKSDAEDCVNEKPSFLRSKKVQN